MKILLLTPLYKLPGESILNNTNVCDSFAKEWVKLGHEVRLIYQYPIYNKIFHIAADLFAKQIANKFYGTVTINRFTKINKYLDEGVEVIRIPLYKFAPHFLYPTQSINYQINEIIRINKEDNFIPDIITGHFYYPNIEIVGKLKHTYQNSRTCIIIHYQGINIKKTKKYLDKTCPQLINSIDVWGYRSHPIREYFEKVYGHKENFFYCYSGIPTAFLESPQIKHYNPLNSFIYIGALIKRKYPLAVLKSLERLKIDFTLGYIGEGNQRQIIEQYAKKKNISKSVKLYGHIERTSIIKLLDKAQVFIMISRKETFGLVYIEAMARHCIVIASRNEGMEGIIKHGVNGFLCNAGDDKELSQILNYIYNLTADDKQKIANNAYETAQGMTDKIVANSYLQNITEVDNVKLEI